MAGLAVCMAGSTASLEAAPPTASRLFPKHTVAYLSVANARQLQERFLATAWGQMLEDPQMKPLAERLRGAVSEVLRPQEERMGLKLGELFSILQGEVSLAVVAMPDGPPALLFLADAGEQGLAVDAVLKAADRALTEAGAERQSETLEGVELVRYTRSGRAQSAAWFQKDGWLAVGTHVELLKGVLAAFQGQGDSSLADNESFAAITRSTSGAKGEEPQVVFFVNPITFFKETGRGSAGAAVGLALVPALGLDGLLGIGGSITLAAGQFDTISRVHVLLDNPRGGVLAVLAPSTGDSVPEAWVPAAAAEYNTLHWDLDTTWRKLARLVDSFQGDGALRRQAQRVLDRAELDIEEDVLAVLDGRFTWYAVVEEPITPLSRGFVLAARLKNVEHAQKIIDKLSARFADVLVRETYAGKTYYSFSGPRRADPENSPPKSGLALVGDYLLVGRASLLEQALVADPEASLAEALDYKLIASKAQRTSGGGQPCLLRFERPEEGLRMLYGLAVAERTRQRLNEAAQNNAFLGSVNQALKDHPLPPLETLTRYLAPGGSVLVNDESGLRFTTFTLRRGSP